MSDVLEKLVRAYVTSPMEPEISLDQVPIVSENISNILSDHDIYIGDVYSTDRFYNITLENSDGDMYAVPGPYKGDVSDIDNFIRSLACMKEAFPEAENAAVAIRYMMKQMERENHLYDCKKAYFEKLIDNYISGPKKPNLYGSQVDEMVTKIYAILKKHDISIIDVYGDYNIVLSGTNKDAGFSIPGDDNSKFKDILDFCDRLSVLDEKLFPNAEAAVNDISDMIHEEQLKNQTQEHLLECQMITRAGKIVKLHECSDNDDWYTDYEMYLRDDKGKLYQKELWSSTVFSCTPEGEPCNAVGKIDVRDLWEQFGDVPMNPETEKLEFAWGKFPENTFREDIWHWFENEFRIPVHDLMYDMEKVDKQLLSFNKDVFNLKEDRSFSRKKLEQTQSQGR